MRKTANRKHAGVALCVLALFATPGVLAGVPAMAATETVAEQAERPDFHGFAGAFLAGRAADLANDKDAAIDFYRSVLDFDSGNVAVKERLMVMLFVSGRFDDGMELVATLEDDPAAEQIRTLALAVNAIRNEDYSGAATLLDTSSTDSIDHLLNTLLDAWAEFGAGSGEAALTRIKNLEGPPWYPVFTMFHAGAMAESLGRIDEAREFYESAITDQERGGIAPDTFVRAVMALAGLEARAGNQRAALDALAVGEQFVTSYAPLAALRQTIEAGEKPEPEVSGPQEGAAAALFTLGSALNQPGAEETVMLYLQFARVLDPENAATLVMLGSIQETLGKPEEAIKLYRQVPKDSPMRRVSELQLGLALASLERIDEARKHLEALIEADPTDLQSYRAYGRVLAVDEDYEELARVFEQAVKVAGPAPTRESWNLFYQLGIAYERLDLWPKAEAAFKRALQLYPDQPQVMNYLGYSWIDMNMNLDEAMELIRAAVDQRPNDGYIVDSLGWAYYRLGKYEEAARELERAVELRPADATINDHLGDAYWRVGRKLEAGFQWKRALASDPDEEMKANILEKLEHGLPDPQDAAGGAQDQAGSMAAIRKTEATPLTGDGGAADTR